MNDKSSRFLTRFRPYQGRYILQVREPGLWSDTSWYTRNERLSSELIARAITERLIVGWYTTHVLNVLGTDIDDHRGEAWKGKIGPSATLLAKYGQVVQRIGEYPSLLVQSPHGLHAYWIFTERLAAEILLEQAKRKLAGLDVEIRPTPTTALRIPAERRLLDPPTLKLLGKPFEEAAEQAPLYHPVLLFGETPESIRETLLQKRRKLRSFRSAKKIEEAEAGIHFYDGASNDAFLELCRIYRCAGLTPEEAFWRFRVKLEASPLYDGELRHNPNRLMRRIESEYRNNADWQPKRKAVQQNLFDQLIAENVARGHPWAPQRTKPFQRFLLRVLDWAAWHDAIWLDPGQVAVFDFLYPWYRKNRKDGLYPLPKRFLQTANQRYFDFMPWLESIGFFTPTAYKPSAYLHKCRYYQLERQGFLPRCC